MNSKKTWVRKIYTLYYLTIQFVLVEEKNSVSANKNSIQIRPGIEQEDVKKNGCEMETNLKNSRIIDII